MLVNGRRVAISSFAESVTTNFVDINTIPVAAIERVEVLKDGASALYGSDAVAGVINIVLRKDFEGVEIAAGYGDVTERQLRRDRTASAIWGIGGEDINVTMIFDYFKNQTLCEHRARHAGLRQQTPQGGGDFRSSRGYPGPLLRGDGQTITIGSGLPAGQPVAGPDLPVRLRSVEPAGSRSPSAAA